MAISEDATPTVTLSSSTPQILVSQQMPPPQPSNQDPTTSLEQEQLSFESNTNEKVSRCRAIDDSSSDSESLKAKKKKEEDAESDRVIPHLKSIIGPGQGEVLEQAVGISNPIVFQKWRPMLAVHPCMYNKSDLASNQMILH